MNKYIITALLVFVALAAKAEDVWLWPIKGQQAGEGILYRPQDYIGDEFNFDKVIPISHTTNLLPDRKQRSAPKDGISDASPFK